MSFHLVLCFSIRRTPSARDASSHPAMSPPGLAFKRGRQGAVPSRRRLRGVANKEHTMLSRILPLGLAALALAVSVVAAADKTTTAADKDADNTHSGIVVSVAD